MSYQVEIEKDGQNSIARTREKEGNVEKKERMNKWNREEKNSAFYSMFYVHASQRSLAHFLFNHLNFLCVYDCVRSSYTITMHNNNVFFFIAVVVVVVIVAAAVAASRAFEFFVVLFCMDWFCARALFSCSPSPDLFVIPSVHYTHTRSRFD